MLGLPEVSHPWFYEGIDRNTPVFFNQAFRQVTYFSDVHKTIIVAQTNVLQLTNTTKEEITVQQFDREVS